MGLKTIILNWIRTKILYKIVIIIYFKLIFKLVRCVRVLSSETGYIFFILFELKIKLKIINYPKQISKIVNWVRVLSSEIGCIFSI